VIVEFIAELWQWIIEKSIISLVVVPTIGYFSLYLVHASLRAWRFIRSRRRALQAVAREAGDDATCEGKGVWLTAPIEPPPHYWRGVTTSKVLAIANLKGGVGKTTLAANIGAYLAKDWQKNVLLIDLDFQGSLSSMAFPGKDWLPTADQSSLATRLISGDINYGDVPVFAEEVDLKIEDDSASGGLQVITAYYDLAQADNRIMVEWLLEYLSRTPRDLRSVLTGKFLRASDVRYTLAKVLHSKAVQKAFDLIIIDCPPRLTTSKIQALCASSHLLIPTIFDRTSAEAVVSLCDQVETLKNANICPYIVYIGVVGTMWKRPNRVAQTEAVQLVQDALADGPTRILPEKTFVPHAAALVNDAGEGIAYIAMPEKQDRSQIRSAIAGLAEYVAGQMGIPRPADFLQAAESFERVLQ
jgi:chromosome partitioning protein